MNIEARNIVWLEPADVSWIEHSGNGVPPQIAFLWGQPKSNEQNGTYLRLPAGAQGTVKAVDDWLKAVVIKGDVAHRKFKDGVETSLQPGSYFHAETGTAHNLSCNPSIECLFYISALGKISISTR